MNITRNDFEGPVFKAFESKYGEMYDCDDFCIFWPEHSSVQEIAVRTAAFVGPAPTVFLYETLVWESSRKHDLEKIVTDRCPELGGLTDGFVIEFEDSPTDLVIDFLQFAMASVHAILVDSQDKTRTLVATGDEGIFARAGEGDVDGWNQIRELMELLQKVWKEKRGE